MQDQINRLNLINKAIRVATMAHEGQYRKSGRIPYIVHPYAAAMVARNYTDDIEVITACLLHDILEDVKPEKYSEAQMRSDFGDTITNLVKAVSEIKTAGQPAKPWRERKDSYLARLSSTEDKRACIVSCADKICNLSDTLNDYENLGDAVWDRFNADQYNILWYYSKCLQAIHGHVPAVMYQFAEELVERLEKVICGDTLDPAKVTSAIENHQDPQA